MANCCGTRASCATTKACCDKKLNFQVYSRHSGKKCVPTKVYGVRKFVCRFDRRVQLGQAARTCCY